LYFELSIAFADFARFAFLNFENVAEETASKDDSDFQQVFTLQLPETP